MVDSTGFVTSLVINVAIAIIAMCFFIYARPRYPWCYDTRRNAKRRVIGTEPPTIRPGAFSWVTQTLLMTDAQILSTAGLDGLMMIKFFEMCFTLFSVLIVLGIGILLPVNFTGPNFSDPGKRITDAFDQMSMATIPPGNRRFWAHLIVGYCFCFTFYYLAFHMWKSYMNLRHQHLARWTLLGGNHTILIHELPAEIRTDAALLAHFNGLYPGQVRSARMAKDLRMDAKERKEGRGDNELDSLQDNVAARDNVIAALEHDVAAWNKQQTDPKVPEEKRAIRAQTATKMLCCGKTDAIDYHYSELERLNRIIAAKQASYEPTRDAKSIPTLLSGFVTFHSARIAVAAANAYTYDSVSFSFDVKAAPELRDVYWPALNLTHFQRSMRTIIFDILTALLIVFWMIPMAFLTGLSNLSGLAEKYSWLSGINSIPSVILGFIEAYLPAILLAVFFAILPLILLAFSQQQGIEANSWLERSVIHKYFMFMVVNFFFGAIVGGAIFSNIQELLGDVNGIPTVLGNQIPTVSNYFVNYVALAAFAGFPLQMAQAPRLIVGGLKKKYLSLTTREFEAAEAPPSLNYGVSYCPHLFIFLVAMTYSFIAPIIVPFAAVYYGLGWMVHKYQIVHVYVQSFESGGVFWPVVYSKMSASLFIAQVCLVGILGLKEVPAQAALVVPLPFITLAFDYYISKAIKSKLISLPLSQMLEIDTLRKAERLAREGDNETTDKKAGPVPTKDGAAGGSDSSRDQSARAASQSGAVHAGSSAPGQVDMSMPDGRLASDLVSARASDLPKTSMQYENRNEDATVSTPKVRLHTLPRVVQQADQNGVTGQTRSYVADEPHQQEVQLKGSEVQQASGKAGSEAPRATHTLGFPYANDEQDRAFVEGDVPAYVQPELTDATPAEVVVDGAQQLLSHSEAAKQTTVVRISEAGRGHQQKQQHDAAAASVAHDQRDVEAQTHAY